MRRLVAVALLVAACGALWHFWRSTDPSTLTAAGEPRVTPLNPATVQPPDTMRASASSPPPPPMPAPSRALTTDERPATTLTRIELRAPPTVVSGQTFPVMIDVQAPVGVRQLSFSVTNSK